MLTNIFKYSNIPYKYDYTSKVINLILPYFNDNVNLVLAHARNDGGYSYENNMKKIISSAIVNKFNILYLIGDEDQWRFPILEEAYYLIFRTYNNNNTCNYDRVFPIPCGHNLKHILEYNNDSLTDAEIQQYFKPFDERKLTFSFSGQLADNRLAMVNAIFSIKDYFSHYINITDRFAAGIPLKEFYNILGDSKIAIVPVGKQIDESFRFFEAARMGCIILTDFPVDKYKDVWYYNNAAAHQIHDWRELDAALIVNLLNNSIQNKEVIQYYEDKLSFNAVAEYITKIIKQKTNGQFNL